mmetsp:Transcript_4569/g.12198  ORF Transcript_4569/g.12198 Transcript_4569/m.12198 type:complete len:105 (-) Transcript_4569:2147-2461(-)
MCIFIRPPGTSVPYPRHKAPVSPALSLSSLPPRSTQTPLPNPLTQGGQHTDRQASTQTNRRTGVQSNAKTKRSFLEAPRPTPPHHVFITHFLSRLAPLCDMQHL